MPVVAEKYVYGYVYNADGEPEVGSTVTAELSDRIVRAVDNLIIETDETVESTATTAPNTSDPEDDGGGKWVIALHPNNLPGDSPINTHWTITEPSGHQESIFIPWDHAAGGSIAGAIPYTSLIVAPEDLEEPIGAGALEDISDLQNAVAALNSNFDLLASANTSGLTLAGKSTILADAALAAGSDATGSTHGLLTATDYTLLQTFKTGGTNDTTLLARQDTKGVILPIVADPTLSSLNGTARAYVSSTDGGAKIQQGGASGRTTVAPGLVSPSWQATTDIPINNTVQATIASFPLLANGLYFISGPIFYRADKAVDMTCRFASIPSGATLRWGYVGITDANTGNDGVGSINTTCATGNEQLTFGGASTTPLLPAITAHIFGTIRVGATAGTVTFQAMKGTTGAAGAILAASSLFFIRQA